MNQRKSEDGLSKPLTNERKEERKDGENKKLSITSSQLFSDKKVISFI